jgi:vacuolar-type H+-ATPase subunit E/Vma4
MASEKVLSDEILKDAATKAERIRKRAERDAAKRLEAAAREAEAARERALDVARRRADRAAASILATVEQESRRDLLVAQEAELDKLFDAARQRLADRKGYDYPAVVAGLAAQAIRAVGSGQVVMELAEADRALATEAWLAEVRRRVRTNGGADVAIAVSPNPAPIDGGVVVRSADGRLVYDNSFAARLRRLRPDLRRELAAKVFGGTGF